MARSAKKPPPRPDDRARREFVDTATGAPVKPAPARRRRGDGAAPTGRVVADVEGVEVPLEPDEVLGQEGTHPREQRFDYDPAGPRKRAKAAARERAPRRAKLHRPRELRETFDSPAEAAAAFYTANELFFDGVRDPGDGLRDWLDGSGTPPRDQARILALRGAPAIRAALALVFGRAQGKRWDAVERHNLERLGGTLEPYYEEPAEGGQPGIYDWSALDGIVPEAIESLPPSKRAAVRAIEAREEIETALERLRETYERRRACVPEHARPIIERRIAEWQRWADDPERIPSYACEPDPHTGGITCNYPSVLDELRAIREACEAEGYDPDWSTVLSREGAPGYPDTSRGPSDPLLEPAEPFDERDAVPCLSTELGRPLGAPPNAIRAQRIIDGVLYRFELRTCGFKPRAARPERELKGGRVRKAKKGRDGCHCYEDFPANAHGPYWYAYPPDGSGGYCRAIYIGKDFREVTP